MKKIVSAIFLAVFAIALVACKPKDNKTIGFAASTFTNPFFNDVKEGIEKGLEGSGYKLVALGADNDAAKQTGQIEDLIAQRVSLILLNPVDSTTVGTKIDEAVKAGITVITLDRSADSDKVTSHVASDNVAGGRLAGEYLKAIYDEQPEAYAVLQLLGQIGASAATDRQNGFESAFGKASINQSTSGNWTRDQGQSITEAFLQSNPNKKILVFAANDEMAMGSLVALEAAKVDYHLVGFDAIDDAVNAVKAGRMDGTVAQNPVEIGRLAAVQAVKLLNGETIEKYIPVPLELIKK